MTPAVSLGDQSRFSSPAVTSGSACRSSRRRGRYDQGRGFAVSVRWGVTPEKIDAAVKRLVEVAHPSRIILFGSAARDETRRNSDADLLVVVPGDVDPTTDDWLRFRRALRSIDLPVDLLVVSEERLAELGDRPGLVYREALRTGKVVYGSPTMSPRKKKRSAEYKTSDAGLPHDWLRHAHSDLASVHLLRGHHDVLPAQVCFHAQQAVEKALKAVLALRGADVPPTHDIEELLEAVEKADLTLPIPLASADALTRFAVQTRYPNPPHEIDEAEAKEAVGLAEQTVAWAAALVPIPEEQA